MTGAPPFGPPPIFVLGFFLQWFGISDIAPPLFPPLFSRNGVDLVWLGVLIGSIVQSPLPLPPSGWSPFFPQGRRAAARLRLTQVHATGL